ncbi:phosphoserine phosphatase SerB [Kocuria marina]|uniref:phosphoserine phosphatase n=1 Tax=Kocuria marina subsp. indica TaxID=1049583 RepID=A0A1X7DNE5_9MICC|nr:phosphoserine phosphatase SerB [Kocuria indica]OXS81940.1 phosphoserine phosphatase SerB [Kocuria indica]RLP59315.1 phosphoserine phosphatase SerB [Kocuria indica]SMF18621.1 phosphoserine phosphatase [Kocuria indica]
MSLNCAVVALAVSPEDGATEAVLDAVERAGAVVETHNWVRVTGTASDGQAADVEGYNALTVRVQTEDPQQLRRALQPDPQRQLLPGIDLNVVPHTWFDQSRKKLVVLDVDSTLIRQEVIELLAAHVGREAEVAAVTERAMRGEIDFAASLRERVAVLEGLPASVIDDVAAAVRLSPGAKVLVQTLLREGHAVAAVSGGFSQVLDPLAARLELTRAAANELEIQDGVLTGRVAGRIVDRAVKAEVMGQWAQELGVAPEDVMAVGDGANDIDMARAAGLSVAYRAKPALREVADTQLSLPNLDALRFFLDL